MTNKLTMAIIGIIIVAASAYAYQSTKNPKSQNENTANDETAMKNETLTKNPVDTDSQSITDKTPTADQPGSYQEYDQRSFESQSKTKRVLFFHANWCSTCKSANQEFTQNLSKIPTDVTLFKTDYDTEKNLKKKYNITYQHTFVLVDENGNELTKWNGGGINELIANTSSDSLIEK